MAVQCHTGALYCHHSFGFLVATAIQNQLNQLPSLLKSPTPEFLFSPYQLLLLHSLHFPQSIRFYAILSFGAPLNPPLPSQWLNSLCHMKFSHFTIFPSPKRSPNLEVDSPHPVISSVGLDKLIERQWPLTPLMTMLQKRSLPRCLLLCQWCRSIYGGRWGNGRWDNH